MAIDFTFEIFGEEQIARRLSRFGDGVEDFRPAFGSIVERLREDTQEQFSQAGRGLWPPLSPAYAAWKAVHYPGKPIMRRSDHLYNSLVGRSGDSVLVMQPMEMRWGTKTSYAKYHQLGKGVPQRRVVDLSELEKKMIIKELQAYMVKMDTTDRSF